MPSIRRAIRKGSYTGALLRAEYLRQKAIRDAPVEELVLAARQNTEEGFYAFRRYVCYPEAQGAINEPASLRYAKPRHHVDWTQRLYTGKDSGCLRGIAGDPLLILSPRGSAKSTFATEWFAHQIGIQTGYGIPIKLMLLSYNVTISEQKSEQIQRIVASPRYRTVFPHVWPGKNWAKGQWEIDKAKANLPMLGEPYTVTCSGLTGGVVSKRAHIIFGDDIIKSPKDIANPYVREQMVSNWRSAVKPVLYPGGRYLILGTRMTGDDIYVEEFNEDKGWEVVEQSAIELDEEGRERSYWPEQFSLDYLRSLRDPPSGDAVSFSFQYQNKIVAIGGLSIPAHWLHHRHPADISEYVQWAVGSDLAASKGKEACYTVLTLMGRRRDGTIDVIDYRRGRSPGNLDKLKWFLELLWSWGLLDDGDEPLPPSLEEILPSSYKSKTGVYVDFFIEDFGQQKSIKDDFQAIVHNVLKLWNLTPRLVQFGMTDKRERLMQCTGHLQRGAVQWNPVTFPHRGEYLREFTNFGAASYDDCVDSFTCGAIGMGLRGTLQGG